MQSLKNKCHCVHNIYYSYSYLTLRTLIAGPSIFDNNKWQSVATIKKHFLLWNNVFLNSADISINHFISSSLNLEFTPPQNKLFFSLDILRNFPYFSHSQGKLERKRERKPSFFSFFLHSFFLFPPPNPSINKKNTSKDISHHDHGSMHLKSFARYTINVRTHIYARTLTYKKIMIFHWGNRTRENYLGKYKY